MSTVKIHVTCRLLRASLMANGWLALNAIPPSIPNQIKNHTTTKKMRYKSLGYSFAVVTAFAALMCVVAPAQAQDKKPNILFIMGDDIGWMQPSCYHRGL